MCMLCSVCRLFELHCSQYTACVADVPLYKLLSSELTGKLLHCRG